MQSRLGVRQKDHRLLRHLAGVNSSGTARRASEVGSGTREQDAIVRIAGFVVRADQFHHPLSDADPIPDPSVTASQCCLRGLGILLIRVTPNGIRSNKPASCISSDTTCSMRRATSTLSPCWSATAPPRTWATPSQASASHASAVVMPGSDGDGGSDSRFSARRGKSIHELSDLLPSLTHSAPLRFRVVVDRQCGTEERPPCSVVRPRSDPQHPIPSPPTQPLQPMLAAPGRPVSFFLFFEPDDRVEHDASRLGLPRGCPRPAFRVEFDPGATLSSAA